MTGNIEENFSKFEGIITDTTKTAEMSLGLVGMLGCLEAMKKENFSEEKIEIYQNRFDELFEQTKKYFEYD